MAKTITDHNVQWNTVHDNGPFDTEILYETIPDKSIQNSFEKYNDTSIEIRRLLKESLDKNKRFRAYGSSWSLSTIAHQKDAMHFNSAMNIVLPVEASDVHEYCATTPDNLFLFQCGNTVKEISKILKRYNKSLPTSGASNGQTIAGAISTGVHGSALDFGAMQDFVVGLHLIIGPDKEDSVYIERSSSSYLNNAFAEKIEARVLRNDGLFNAALVGLGSFGFIQGVIVQAEDIFLLKRYTKHIDRKEAIKLFQTLDFENSSFKIDEETTPDGKATRPYHYKIYLNPYNDDEDGVAEVIYKKEYRDNYPNPIPIVSQYIYKDLTSWISSFAARYKRAIPRVMRALRGTIFPKLDQVSEGTLGEIFWDSTFRGAGFAWTFGIDHSKLGEALNIFIEVLKKHGPVPGAIGIRIVKATKAILGFTRFPYTCILEMDGIQWSATKKMISMQEFERYLLQAFRTNNIEFTMHWGKNADWGASNLIDYMYGNKGEEWKNYRSALLSKEMANIFSNAFMDTVGLSDYNENSNATLS